MQVNNTYVGRFAPSPTGPLHFGSLVAALASFLDARNHNGNWLVRVEDLDPPREIHGAPNEILEQLTYFGLSWDGDPLFQSNRITDYEQSLAALKASGLIFPCTCSRRSYASVYPGKCRNQISSTQQSSSKDSKHEPSAERILVNDQMIEFDDLFLGPQSFDLGSDVGDFILKRKDGLFAYQLAVVVDDQAQGITHVIRGNDLLDSTPRQIYVGQCLGFRALTYGHFPVVLGHDGHKLSKQSKAPPLPMNDAPSILNQALRALGQSPVPSSSVSNLLRQATEQWDRNLVPKLAGISADTLQL